MAKVKAGGNSGGSYKAKPVVRRPGVHAKTKMSKTKSSKNYVKMGRGQGCGRR
jgi:hypothetical protein